MTIMEELNWNNEFIKALLLHCTWIRWDELVCLLRPSVGEHNMLMLFEGDILLICSENCEQCWRATVCDNIADLADPVYISATVC